MSYSIEMLSLSKIGDMLRERLGDEVDQYKFPEDFEKAVIDIGFSALVIDGDTAPYDEVIFIGDIGDKITIAARTDVGGAGFKRYKKATFIGATKVSPYQLYSQINLENLVLNEGITAINTGAFSGTTLGDVILPESVTSLGGAAFASSTITSIYAPSVETIGSNNMSNGGTFGNCQRLKHVNLPKLKIVGNYYNDRRAFCNCQMLEDVTIGSVGNAFTQGSCGLSSCPSAFILTVYTTTSYVNSLLTDSRNCAANATIIIKAATDTVYNGETYSAGDTIITSLPA